MKIKYILFVTTLLGTSCSKDFLNEVPITDQSSVGAYTSEQGLKLGVVALYSINRVFYADEGSAIAIVRGDDLTVHRAAHDTGTALYDANLSPTNGTYQLIWSLNYRLIERASSIIEGAEKLSGITDASRKQIISEAKCFRALAYFTLIRNFDNIVLKTTPTLGISSDFTPAVQSEVFDLINADLDYAIASLNYTDVAGRWTKGAAEHLAANVALWLKDWPRAEALAKDVISKGPYKLLNEPKAVFEGVKLNHQEAIFVLQFEPGVVGGGSYHRWAQYFTPMYANVRGMKADPEQGGRNGWARTFPNKYLLGLYESNDKRLTQYYKLNWTYNNPATLPAGKKIGDVVLAKDAGDAFTTISPCTTKYWDKVRDIASAESYKDIITMRLAETYLIAAEALMRQDKDTEALTYLNAVRQRAGATPLDVIDENVILDENARELSFEGHRWFTLKRMGKLIERVKLYAGENDRPAPRLNIKDYHIRRPIPQQEIDLMKGFPQNEGYQ